MKINVRYYVMVILISGINLISTAQNIGIGTTTPEGEFHVSKENVIIGPIFNGTGLNDLVVDFDASVELTQDVQYIITLDNAGPIPNLIDVFFEGSLLFDDLPMANSGIQLGSGISIGFSSLSGHTYADSWTINVNPGFLNQLIVKEDKVGIGTNNPITTLDVDGSINFSGSLMKDGIAYLPALSVDHLTDAISTTQNLYIGQNSGNNNLAGSQNLFLGADAGKLQANGSNNVFLGYGAGEFNSTGSGNIYLGNEVSSTSSESNRLRIGNDGSSIPLIYGQFDSEFVGINRNSKIVTQEAFGITKETNSFGSYGGMYIETKGASSSRPFYGFAINNSGRAWIEFDGSSEDVIVNNISGNLSVRYNTATKPIAGSWSANSDARLKKNIVKMSSKEMLDKVLAMQGVHYEWNDDKTEFERPKGQQIGFIAQDLQKIWPEKISEDNLGYLITAYGDYDPVFAEAIKALSKKLDNQAEEIKILKNMIQGIANNNRIDN